jgi:EAL domain-containing protein (putative c-di-GMP-specific phosphodiesterase class I)
VRQNHFYFIKYMGMKAIAEGVETTEQEAFLQVAGCDLLQGYLYSPPLSAERFENSWRKPLNPNPSLNYPLEYPVAHTYCLAA